jgi:toxin YoeB
MKISHTTQSWAQYQFLQSTRPALVEKINLLIKNIQETPFTGLGKPEPLKGILKGCWSRRITHEHRLVYRVEGKSAKQHIIILSCYTHYE